MITLNLKPSLRIFLVLLFGVLVVACDSNSSGSKESQQLDNDNDPTAVENSETHDPLLGENSGEMDERGEFVIVEDFDQNDWVKISQDFKLGIVEDSTLNRINTKTLGADAWKPWGDYQFRLIYFSEGGSLKAKPLLRNKGNEDIEISSHMIDSLNLGELWSEIQRSSSTISNNFK